MHAHKVHVCSVLLVGTAEDGGHGWGQGCTECTPTHTLCPPLRFHIHLAVTEVCTKGRIMRTAMLWRRASLVVGLVAAGALCVAGAETSALGEKAEGARPDWDYDYDVVEGDVQVERGSRREESRGDAADAEHAAVPRGAACELLHRVPDQQQRQPGVRGGAGLGVEGRASGSTSAGRRGRAHARTSASRRARGAAPRSGGAGNGVNSVSIARGCGVGATIHEIGHSLGLSHEQSRKDRDSFVRIDLSQVQRGMEFNFNKNSRTGRDMGKYDYGSIMHYGAYGFATGRQPVITAPAPIGQRNGLSAGDVAAIDFMYNGCSPTFSRPRCLASVGAETHTVQPSRTFTVDFNAVYDPVAVDARVVRRDDRHIGGAVRDARRDDHP